jgi:hypothetical protein
MMPTSITYARNASIAFNFPGVCAQYCEPAFCKMSAVEGPLLGVVLAGVAALEGVAVLEAAIVAVNSFQLIATRLYIQYM